MTHHSNQDDFGLYVKGVLNYTGSENILIPTHFKGAILISRVRIQNSQELYT